MTSHAAESAETSQTVRFPLLSSLTHLSLRNNRITEKGAANLGRSLGVFPKCQLLCLNLAFNEIGDEGAKAIAKVRMVLSLPLLLLLLLLWPPSWPLLLLLLFFSLLLLLLLLLMFFNCFCLLRIFQHNKHFGQKTTLSERCGARRSSSYKLTFKRCRNRTNKFTRA